MQIVTGIFLTMHYKPDAAQAFDSVEYIMRDVPCGWLIRYMHSTGASVFFIVVYLHMFRALLYGSYRKPRELLWLFGMLIYLALMAEAFMGYVLPWGKMSYWGAQVIINLFGTIPGIGDGPVGLDPRRLRHRRCDAEPLLLVARDRVPLVLLALVVAHLVALHEVGSNNPDGIEIKKKKAPRRQAARRHPVPSVLHGQGHRRRRRVPDRVRRRRVLRAGVRRPVPGAHNFIPADPLSTPPHIAPVWYFTPYYAILRAVPPCSTRSSGACSRWARRSLLFFLLPWLDRGTVKSIRYRGPICKVALTVFVVSFLVLGCLGTAADQLPRHDRQYAR